jgi:arylsulfatase A-like enzyme
MYGHTVTAFYEYLDAWLGRIQAERDPETTLVVMSDHGFESKLDDGEEGIHDSAPPGILVLQGPGIRAGQRLEGATIYDIMPTLAVLLDLPVARDLPGHVLETALEPAWRQPNPTRWVATYGPRPPQVPQGTSETLDQGLEDDLRAVGYLR